MRNTVCFGSAEVVEYEVPLAARLRPHPRWAEASALWKRGGGRGWGKGGGKGEGRGRAWGRGGGKGTGRGRRAATHVAGAVASIQALRLESDDERKEREDEEPQVLAPLGGAPGGEEEREGGDVDRVLSEEEAGWYRGAAARANYLGMDRIDIAFAAKELCRRMAVPRCSDLAALRRLCQYLVGAPRLVQSFAWQPAGRGLEVFTDTDFAGCPRTRRSTNGGCCMRGSHLIKHWAKIQQVVTLSSAEAELGGVVYGACEGLGVQAVAVDLGISAAVRLRADSAAAIGICNRTGIGRVRHLAVGQLWIQERLRSGGLTLRKVLGSENPADPLT